LLDSWATKALDERGSATITSMKPPTGEGTVTWGGRRGARREVLGKT